MSGVLGERSCEGVEEARICVGWRGAHTGWRGVHIGWRGAHIGWRMESVRWRMGGMEDVGTSGEESGGGGG